MLDLEREPATEATDKPRADRLLSPVIKALLIISIAMFLAELLMAEELITWLALWPATAPHPEVIPRFWPWQLVSYAFLHGSLGHLAVNMFGLWMLGVRIENHWGSRRFLFYYFTCVLGAGAVQLLVSSLSAQQGHYYPTLGASGGVFGVLLAFGMLFPNQILVLLIPPILMKAKWFVIGYAAIELGLGVTGTAAGIAHFAHLGGMLFGFLLIQYWRSQERAG